MVAFFKREARGRVARWPWSPLLSVTPTGRDLIPYTYHIIRTHNINSGKTGTQIFEVPFYMPSSLYRGVPCVEEAAALLLSLWLSKMVPKKKKKREGMPGVPVRLHIRIHIILRIIRIYILTYSSTRSKCAIGFTAVVPQSTYYGPTTKEKQYYRYYRYRLTSRSYWCWW